MARTIELLEVEMNRGRGTADDPVRVIKQYWSKDGEVVATQDPCAPVRTPDGRWLLNHDTTEVKEVSDGRDNKVIQRDCERG